MDISLNTLDLLVSNNRLYLLEKYTNLETKRELKRDILFYRKRIFQTTKECLKFSQVNPAIQISFDAFARELIAYFKFEDKKDIFQGEYKELDDEREIHIQNVIKQQEENNNLNSRLSPIEEEQCINKTNNPNDLIMNFPQVKVNTIDECLQIKIIKTQSKEIKILPQQKTINLRDKHLRTKGVKKKNNKYFLLLL